MDERSMNDTACLTTIDAGIHSSAERCASTSCTKPNLATAVIPHVLHNFDLNFGIFVEACKGLQHAGGFLCRAAVKAARSASHTYK